jgi:BASS family bile acid:Na+ symporter
LQDLRSVLPIWIQPALLGGVVLTVFALGLHASVADATYLFRRPAELGRALLAMNVVVPVFAAAMLAMFHLRPAVDIALVALAVSPIPPLLPKRAMKSGGSAPYTIGLLVAAAVLAIVFVPFAVYVLGRLFWHEARISPVPVAAVVALTVLAPLAVGMLVRGVAPGFADRAGRPVSVVATLLVLAAAVPVLFVATPLIVSLIGDGTLAAMIAMAVVGLAAGHFLGGPIEDHRAVLALTCSSRHPGVALAIATANFPDAKKPVAAAILLYLLVNVLVAVPYQAWSKRHLHAVHT